jgi:DNA-directed RNA polymerase subunit RPC12/RpoP
VSPVRPDERARNQRLGELLRAQEKALRPDEPQEPEAGEPGYRCPSCGEKYDSKMRSPEDVVCFECRMTRGEE